MLNNYFTLFKITQELNQLLRGKSLEFIASDSAHTLYLQFEEQTVVIHIGSGKNYIFYQNKYKKLPVPHFKKFKELNGLKFIRSETFYQERILELIFENDFRLRAFLFQPQSNVILMDHSDVIDLYFQQKMERFQSLYAGSFNHAAMPNPAFICHLLSNRDTDSLVKNVPSLARGPIFDELMHRVESSSNSCIPIIREFIKELQNIHSVLLFSEEKLKNYQYFLPYIPTTLPENTKAESYDSVSRAIQIYVSVNRRHEQILSLKNALQKTLKTELKYIRNSMQRLRVQLRKSQDKDKYHKLAQLILWNIHQIPEGVQEAEVVDYEDPDLKKVNIQLNPNLSPKAYADELFARAKRLENVSEIEERIQLLEKKRNIIEQYLMELEEITNIKELKRWPDRLHAIGIDVVSSTKKSSSQPERMPFREYYFQGYTIRVGKSAKESDELTLKLSKKYDWFFHAQDIRGSHVIVTHSEKKRLEQLAPSVIEVAAIIAAHFSEARHSSYVPVQYTQVRYIRKPRKSPAGFVTFHTYKTVFVNPSKFEQLEIKTKKDLIP
jgi:predicted ribosome quality control (RQC) complex YloA/Tae2 family protein